MKNKIFTLLAVGGCSFIATAALSDTAQITGRVVSTSGKGIEGVSVKLVSSVDDRIGRKVEPQVTDTNGNFFLSFEWTEVERAIQSGATWQVCIDKAGYLPDRRNLLLSPRKVPAELKIEMVPKQERDRLMSRVDSCANRIADSSTIYIFDFVSDKTAPEKLNFFEQLLEFKLKSGIRADLESARLLLDHSFEIKLCPEAPVRDEQDALFAGKRLGCPGVISGYIEEGAAQLKSVVRFTALVDPPLTDFAPVTFSSDLASLIQPSQRVNNAYLAFSSFILGMLYLKEGQTSLAMQCFQHTKDTQPTSGIASRADEVLKSLKQASPSKDLVPIGGARP